MVEDLRVRGEMEGAPYQCLPPLFINFLNNPTPRFIKIYLVGLKQIFRNDNESDLHKTTEYPNIRIFVSFGSEHFTIFT